MSNAIGHTTALRTVLVKYGNVLYTCRCEDFGFLCGQCGVGLLGINPRLRSKCKKCGASVAEKQTVRIPA